MEKLFIKYQLLSTEWSSSVVLVEVLVGPNSSTTTVLLVVVAKLPLHWLVTARNGPKSIAIQD